MRRMLDPKTIGGGSAAKLYSHFISIKHVDPARGFCVFNFISSSDKQIKDIDELTSTIKNKKFACSGKLVYEGKLSVYFQISGGDPITASSYDVATGAVSPSFIVKGNYKMSDSVSLIS